MRLAHLADGTVTNVTPCRFDDTSSAFTLDGKYLAFLSNAPSIRSMTRTAMRCRSEVQSLRPSRAPSSGD
jgi:hypothetical protein